MKLLPNKNTILLFAFVFISILYLETVFRILALGVPIDWTYLHVVAFSLTYSAFIVFGLRLFKPRMFKILLGVSFALLVTFYFSQNVYYEALGNFYTFAVAADAGRGLPFIDHLIIHFSLWHLSYYLPFICVIALLKWHRKFKDSTFDIFATRYKNYYLAAIPLVFAWSLGFLTVQSISTAPFGDIDEEDTVYQYTAQDLYETNFSPELTINRFGLFTYARVDYRVANDFMEVNEEIDAWVERYFERREHESNDMTGIFEDKNLIMITAESLDFMSMDPSLMPNLMEMQESSMVFENYYAPLYSRNTADTEFMMHTGFFPTSRTTLSMTTFGQNRFMNTIPKGFNDLDYDTFSYHNYSDFYYPRTQFYLETLMFDAFQDAYDMGLLEISHELYELDQQRPPWLSDKEMVENTIDDLLENERFFGYYLSVTGHLPYDSSHEIAERNLPIIEEIFEAEAREPIPESLMYYHAAYYEFDMALGVLLDKLEAYDQADDTVVIIVSDHYPYGLERDTIHDAVPEKNIDESRLNIHNVPMMIYHPDLEGTTHENIFSSIDIMPTIGNLFNLDLDYEYMMGRDYFADDYNVVRFQDSSIMTKDYIIEAGQNLKVTLRNDRFTERDVHKHYNEYIHYYQLNLYILETDYFHRKYADFPIPEED